MQYYGYLSYSYALSDGMCILEGYEFDLTPAHLPTRTDADLDRFTTLPHSAVQLDRGPYRPSKSHYKPPKREQVDNYPSSDIRYRVSIA